MPNGHLASKEAVKGITNVIISDTLQMFQTSIIPLNTLKATKLALYFAAFKKC